MVYSISITYNQLLSVDPAFVKAILVLNIYKQIDYIYVYICMRAVYVDVFIIIGQCMINSGLGSENHNISKFAYDKSLLPWQQSGLVISKNH